MSQRFQMYTHILVVLLKEDELLLEGLDLALKVHAAQVGVIDDLPQPCDVGLDALANGELRFIPANTRRVNGSMLRSRTVQLPQGSNVMFAILLLT